MVIEELQLFAREYFWTGGSLNGGLSLVLLLGTSSSLELELIIVNTFKLIGLFSETSVRYFKTMLAITLIVVTPY